jgi:hypothetical protein
MVKVELSMLALIVLLTCSNHASATHLAQGLDRALRLLAAPDQDVRARSVRQIRTVRANVGNELVAQIEAGLRDPDLQYASSLHFAVIAAGDWRIEEAVPILIEHIDFALDPESFPIGARFPVSAYYPMASALCRIQGTAVSSNVLELLSQPVEGTKLRSAVWVLSESLGRDRAKLALDRMIEQSEGAAKEQFLSARALLDDPLILRAPVK